jgi:hypothetical protein
MRRQLLAAILAAATAGPAVAGSAILFWDPPTQNESGSPLTDLAGYTVSWGCAGSRNYPNQVTILYPALRSFEVQNLPNTGTCYFAVQALNAGRGPLVNVPSRTSESSVYSDEASKAMNANAPLVPYTRIVDSAAVRSPTEINPPPPLEVLEAGRIRRAYVGDPVVFVVDAVSSPAPNRHELRARFIQSGEIIVVPFTAPTMQWTPPFAGLWYVSLRSCNTNGCGEWRSSVEDGYVWWFQLKAPTGGGIDP